MVLSLNYADEKFIHYTFIQPRPQCFPFPSTVISYILKNPISCEGYQKLNQTCKYFFLKQKIMFFMGNTFCIDAFLWMNECEIPVKSDQTNALFWLMDSLRLEYGFYGFEKVYKCTLSCLTLRKITLSLEEFDILTSSNTIKEFVFQYSTVKKDNRNIPIDVILKKLPNVTEFNYLTFFEDFSLETFEKLNELTFSNKFQVFTLWMMSIKDNLDTEIVCKFIQKNAAAAARICFGIDLIPFKQAMEQSINDLLGKWEGLKPTIKIV